VVPLILRHWFNTCRKGNEIGARVLYAGICIRRNKISGASSCTPYCLNPKRIRGLLAWLSLLRDEKLVKARRGSAAQPRLLSAPQTSSPFVLPVQIRNARTSRPLTSFITSLVSSPEPQPPTSTISCSSPLRDFFILNRLVACSSESYAHYLCSFMV